MSLKFDEQSDKLIYLQCKTCENTDCKFGANWYTQDSMMGCSRIVNEQIATKYSHYRDEVIPMWATLQSEEALLRSYNEIIEFLYDEVFSAPTGSFMNHKGKVKKRP